ncbi:MAG: hypothetical protein K2J30_05200 [Clostridia bacterium]|nr:hypothetical protein [Clostridia bacterium]
MGRVALFLQARNKDGRYEEGYCRHYKKSLGVYLRRVFFAYQPTGLFFMCLIMTLVSLFVIDSEEESMLRLIPIILASVAGFFYVVILFYHFWYWKYTKHVFVTDEGIWITSCSTFWWRGAPDYAGRRRLLAPSWSLYSWDELKSVSKTDDTRSVSKLANFFDDFDNFVSKSRNHISLYMKRWDGVERIDALKNSDAEEILEYAETQKKSCKRKIKQEPEDIIEE